MQETEVVPVMEATLATGTPETQEVQAEWGAQAAGEGGWVLWGVTSPKE